MAYHSVGSIIDEVQRVLAAVATAWDAGRHEHEAIDFKQTPDSAGNSGRRAPEKFIKDLAETVVRFSNGPSEGAIVIGVRNKAATRDEAIAGVDATRWEVQDLVQQILARTSPSITVRPTVLDIDGKVIYVLAVPEGRTVYSTTEGIYKMRLHDRCMPLEGEQLRGLRALRQNYDWSADPSEYDAASLSRAALERAARRLRDIGQDETAALADSDPVAFCRATGLWTGTGVNRAAILLYGTTSARNPCPSGASTCRPAKLQAANRGSCCAVSRPTCRSSFCSTSSSAPSARWPAATRSGSAPPRSPRHQGFVARQHPILIELARCMDRRPRCATTAAPPPCVRPSLP